METYYDYAVVRLVPDRIRGETVNIGLVVFHPDRTDIRFGGFNSTGADN
ncbi:DUF3037 domain-containing protein [Phyllobacterium trifolii]